MLGISLLPDPSSCSKLFYHEHNVHSCPFKVTLSSVGPQPHWDLPHSLCAKSWANLLLAALIFPWVSGSLVQRLLLIKPWHTPHKALSRMKYNHQFSVYQNKTQKNPRIQEITKATTGGKQESTTTALKGCSGQADTQLLLTSLCEHSPLPLSWDPACS